MVFTNLRNSLFALALTVPGLGLCNAASMVCEFSPDDPKGDFFLMKEFDERYFGRPGGLVATYKMSPLLRKIGGSSQTADEDRALERDLDREIAELNTHRKDGELSLTGDKRNFSSLTKWKQAIEEKKQLSMNFTRANGQSQEILKVMVPQNSDNQNLAWDDEKGLQDLRGIASLDFADILDSFPCEMKNIRICAKAEPFTKNAKEVEQDSMKEPDLKKIYRRVSVLRIEHCLSDYPMSKDDRETIRKACEEWPSKNQYGERMYVPPSDAGFIGIRHQMIFCRDALNAFLDKQKNLTRNERGKYVPKEHK